jgi:hypothetical protein
VANPNPKTDHLEPWQPGQSGNPAGYSRKRRATDNLLSLIDRGEADDQIAEMWLKMILSGDFRFFKEYLDRTEGKVPDRLSVSDDGDVRDLEFFPLPTGAASGADGGGESPGEVQGAGVRETLGEDAAGIGEGGQESTEGRQGVVGGPEL